MPTFRTPALSIATVLAALLPLGLTPAVAANSAITDAFVAATVPAYAVLRGADDLAIDARSRLRGFARRDGADEASAADELHAWQDAARAADRAAAAAPTLDGLGPLLYPLDALVLPFTVDAGADARQARDTLVRLAGLRGADFDALYIPAATANLRRLIETYVDYIKNGDEPGLRRLAVRNLPLARRRLAEIERP